MKILMVGSGGREHALTWHIAQNPEVTKIFCAPGNPGMANENKVQCIDIPATDIEGQAQLAKQKKIDLTIVGPDDPLAMGMVDRFEQLGLLIFGPNKAMARLEASKVYAKRFMAKLGIPSAKFFVVDETGNETEDMKKVALFLRKFEEGEAVIKGDGLAAGKGVEVSKNRIAAQAFARELLYGSKYGEHKAVVIEKRLHGEEASIIAIVCGGKYVLLDTSQDHKPLLDGDKGPNTGGMGAVSPAPVVTQAIMKRVEREIIQPLINGMLEEILGGFRGVIYLGLIITQTGPQVLEINVRFGDPECQALIMRLKTNLLGIFEEVARGQLKTTELKFDPSSCVTVALTSRGYPDSKEISVPISGWATADSEPFTKVFQAGTRKDKFQLETDGGRVMFVTALGSTLEHAITKTYRAVKLIMFAGMHFRKDIGQKALKHSKQAQ